MRSTARCRRSATRSSRLIDAARTGRLLPSDVGGATVTVCDSGPLLGAVAAEGSGCVAHGARAAGRFRADHALARGRRLGRRNGCRAHVLRNRRTLASTPLPPPGLTMITGIHHFGLTVSDMERSLRFYTELFGLEVVSDREVEARLRRADHRGSRGAPAPRPPLRLREAPGADRVQEPARRAARPPAPRRRQRPRLLPQPTTSTGRWHGFERQASSSARLARSTTTSGPNKGGRGIYVEDPDGNAVEVVQLSPQAAFS